MAVYGRYNNIAWSFLEERNATPDIEPGDLEIMASAKPDFIAFNYYSTMTVAASSGDASDLGSTGDQQIVVGESYNFV